MTICVSARLCWGRYGRALSFCALGSRPRRRRSNVGCGTSRPRSMGACRASKTPCPTNWGRMSDIRQVPAIDGLLAATALTNGLTLVTRNDRDVNRSGRERIQPVPGCGEPAPILTAAALRGGAHHGFEAAAGAEWCQPKWLVVPQRLFAYLMRSVNRHAATLSYCCEQRLIVVRKLADRGVRLVVSIWLMYNTNPCSKIERDRLQSSHVA